MIPPFFIVGEGRSGTTLLRVMLATHPDLAVPWESHFIPYVYARREFFGDLKDIDNRQRLVEHIATILDIAYEKDKWAPGLRANSRSVAEAAEPSYAGVVDAVFRYGTNNAKRWGDKTPRYVLHLPTLKEIFPDAQFIHIVRDGRDVASSIMPVYFGPHTPIAAANAWIKCVSEGEKFVAENPGKAITVRYEELVTDPEALLRRVCDFLGVEYDPCMLDYSNTPEAEQPRQRRGQKTHELLRKAPTPSRISSYKTRLKPDELRLFEAVAGDKLREMGYEMGEQPPPPTDAEIRKDKLRNQLLEIARTPKRVRARLFLWTTGLRIKRIIGR